MNALRESKQSKDVKPKHFEKALNEVTPSLKGKIKEKYDTFKDTYKGAEFR